MHLAVDVISDLICPWCYIGKRRLERAFSALEFRQDVRVRWHPFQLNPTMPKDGNSRRDYLIDRGMEAIEESERLSRRHRVDGVPFFIIDNQITLSGAQISDSFLDAFREVIRPN